jgi:hypothetical protein
MVADLFQTAQLVFGIALAVALLFFAHRFFGWRGVAAGLIALATLGLYRKGRADGRTATIEKERTDAGRAERTADAERVRSDLRNADPAELMRDDGFRRD